MAQLKGKTYEYWIDYITDKFPTDQFDIKEEWIDKSKVFTIIARSSKSKTEIVFEFPTPDLCHIVFYNPDSPFGNAWNDIERQRSMMYSDYELNEENLEATDKYLDIPLNYGWTEKAIYYKNKLVRSELLYFDGRKWQMAPIESNLTWADKAGCLTMLLFWPIIIVQSLFVQHRLDDTNKNTVIKKNVIEPMIQS